MGWRYGLAGRYPAQRGFLFLGKIMSDKGARVYMETQVESIDFGQKTVYAKQKDGTELREPYDKLIIATGSHPLRRSDSGTRA